MKKYINVIFVFVMLLFIPLGVNAENTCDASKVTVKSIELVSKTDNVEEKNNPEVDTNNLLMDLKMSEVEDSITYKIIINNDTDEDFKLNTKSLSLSGNYLDYEIEFENESVIKKNEDNVILLKVKYNKEVPSTEFINGMFNGEENASIYLKNGRILNVPNALKNHTLLIVIVYIITILSVIVGAAILIHDHKKVKPYYLILLLPLFLIPISASAECSYTVNINTKFFVKEKIAMFDQGYIVNGKFKKLAGAETENNSRADENIVHIKRSYDAPNIDEMTSTNIVSSPDSDIRIYAWFEDSTGTIYYYTDYAKPFFNKNSDGFFYYLKKVQDIDITNTNMYYTENLNSFFYECYELAEINLSHLGGDNVNTIRWFFTHCDSLKKVDMSYFNFGKVERMSDSDSIFYPLKTVIEEVNLSHANMSNVLYASNLIYYYSAIKKVDISYINLEKVVSFTHFISCNSLLEELKVDHGNFKSGESMNYMFSENPLIKKMTFDGVNMQGAKTFNYMFKRCYALEELDMGGLVANDDGLKTPNVTTFDELIINCSALKKINLDGLGGPNLSIISYMINSSSNLEDISMKYFKFGVTGTTRVLYYSKNAVLDLTGADMSNARGYEFLYGSSNLKKVIFKDAKMPKSMEGFFGESSVEEVIFDNADFTSTTSFKNMFYKCTNISKIDFKDVTVGDGLTDLSWMFSESSVEEVDLSMFPVNNVTDINHMFYYARNVKKINVSNFEFDKALKAIEAFSFLGQNSDSIEIIGVGTWKINVESNLLGLFSTIGNQNTTVKLGKFDNMVIADNSNCGSLFYRIVSSNTMDLGSINIKAANVSNMLYDTTNVKLTINYHKSGTPSFSTMFGNSATSSGSSVVLNYDAATTQETAQAMVNTKSSNSNVVLGELID